MLFIISFLTNFKRKIFYTSFLELKSSSKFSEDMSCNLQSAPLNAAAFLLMSSFISSNTSKMRITVKKGFLVGKELTKIEGQSYKAMKIK